jgi:predicted nucleic acid-binding protein
LVPQAVWDELKEFHLQLPEFIELHPLRTPIQRLAGTESLGRGEAEALLLARELNAQLLLTDDRQARLAARRLHIPCIGLIGMIVQAKRLGKISNVRAMLNLLETKGGLYLSDTVVATAMQLADEI